MRSRPLADLIDELAEWSRAVTERSEGNREAVDGPVERSYWLLVPVGVLHLEAIAAVVVVFVFGLPFEQLVQSFARAE
jgi:hypothetical protein